MITPSDAIKLYSLLNAYGTMYRTLKVSTHSPKCYAANQPAAQICHEITIVPDSLYDHNNGEPIKDPLCEHVFVQITVNVGGHYHDGQERLVDDANVFILHCTPSKGLEAQREFRPSSIAEADAVIRELLGFDC